jgi:hypothetical protein
MKRPYKIPGGWPVIVLVVLGPVLVLGVAIFSQVRDEGVFNALGLAALFLATGPLLYPVARYFKRRRGETEQQIDIELEEAT